MMEQEKDYRLLELVSFGVEDTEHSMVLIPSGEAYIGLATEHRGPENQKPQHPIRITHSFLLGATLVTHSVQTNVPPPTPVPINADARYSKGRLLD